MGDRSHAIFLDDERKELYVNAPRGRVYLKDYLAADGVTLIGVQQAV